MTRLYLSDTLAWIEKLAILYETLSIQHQRELLRLIIEQIVVDYDGNILDLKLRPPFAYIRNIIKQVGQAGKTKQTNHSASLFDMRSSVKAVKLPLTVRPRQDSNLRHTA